MGVNGGQCFDWTETRVERLKALHADGLSASQIAAAIGGISRNAVIGKLHREGLRREARPSRPARTYLTREEKAARQREGIKAWNTRKAIANAQLRALAGESLSQLEAELIEPDTFLGLSLMDLEWGDGRCRYPQGGEDGEPITFCASPVMKGEVYCRTHCDLCFNPVAPKHRNDPAPAKNGYRPPVTQLRAYGT